MRLLLATLACLAAFAATAYEPSPPAAANAAPQFTFAWPLGETAPTPRGATTRGTDVTLDTGESPAWKALREPGIDAKERDRRAILAMAGEFRVSFDFLEIAVFDPARTRDRPYQSWGTELVLVSEDSGDFIALQHLLVMRMRLPDGSESEPHVVRHWRQEWRWQPDAILAYAGHLRWQPRKVDGAGRWSQSVYQVDDSPRYASLGRWEHNDSHSTWISEETLRPLPRREYTARQDYHALLGTNRHTIARTGWLQEENNLKLALDADAAPRAEMPLLAREYGVARYERIRDFDFSAGRAYFDATEPFWARVRAAWRTPIAHGYTLKAAVDQANLFMPFFEYAQKLADGEEAFDAPAADALINVTLTSDYFVPATAK